MGFMAFNMNKIKSLKKSEWRNKTWLMSAEAQNTTVVIDCWYVQTETGESCIKVNSGTKKEKKNFMNNLWHFLVALYHFSHETKSMKHIIHVALT